MITGAQPDNSTQRQCWPKQYDDIDMECTCYRWDFPVSMGGILGAILFDSGHVQFLDFGFSELLADARMRKLE